MFIDLGESGYSDIEVEIVESFINFDSDLDVVNGDLKTL